MTTKLNQNLDISLARIPFAVPVSLSLSAATPDDLKWMNEVYTQINFQPASAKSDTCVVARLDGERIGMGRLIHFDDQADEVAGIYTDPEQRGKGIASAIVRWLIEQSKARTIYCLPFDHLEAFYSSFGFQTRSPRGDEPEPVRAKLAWCRESQPHDVILMTLDQ